MKKLHRHLESRYEWYSEWHKHPKHQILHWLVLVALVLVTVAVVQNNINTSPNTSFATTVEVYPGPGVDTYKSNLYTVEVYDGSVWRPSYTYKYSRLSTRYAWYQNLYPSVNFTTFGINGPTQVRVSKISGSISNIQISPKSKNISSTISNGKATFTLNPNNKTWITIDGDGANSLFIFADEPKPAVPVGARYFGPGIQDISPTTANHYQAVSNEVIYIDGGAWVKGNIDTTGTTGVQIIGPGVLSGELWTSEFVRSLSSFYEQMEYSMIRSDNGNQQASIKGVTIVASPLYNFYRGATTAYSVKLLSPWTASTDGFNGPSTVDQSFAFIGDNVLFPSRGSLNQSNVTITNSFIGTTNNSVICGCYWGNPANDIFTALVDNIDIKTYGYTGGVRSPGIFQIWVGNNDSTRGFSNQTYQNIRIEGSTPEYMLQVKNRVYPWGGALVYDPPLGNSYNLVFKNITLEGTQGAKSEIMGWDANNMFRNVTLENVKINGIVVTQANLSNYFDINSYVSGLTFTVPTPSPDMSISANPTSITSGSSSTVNYSWNSNTRHNVRLNGVAPTATCANGICTGSKVVNLTTSTTYTLSAVLADGTPVPSVSTIVSVTAFLDTTPPTVSISSPISGATVSSTVSITASATDNVGVTSVEFRRGSTVLGTDTSSPYAYSWNTTTLANGTYSLTATARDAYGNTKTSTAVSVNVNNITVTPPPPAPVDTTPPTVSIITPLNNGIVTRNTTITIEATASDASGISKVEFYIKGVLKCTETLIPYTCVWKIPKNRNAVYTLSAKAYDTAGNTKTSSTVTVTSK